MTDGITPYEALQQALKIAGSQSALARICGVGQPAVWKWAQSSKRVPAEHVLAIETATGVSRHHLRPDIYPITIALPSSPTQQMTRRDAPVTFDRPAVMKGAA